ncbi:MAG TPA: hypothetical protein VJ756_20430, partial [Terriglobales bacterium]|nr:hypothetical protein [Terriglobales bacterium]
GAALIWKADLHRFSYAARPNPHFIGGKAYIGGKFVDIGILFPKAGSNQVICYFVTKSDAGDLGRREQAQNSDPYRLQVIRFDASTGLLKNHLQLPARFGISSVMSSYDGKFIVRTGNLLTLYTSGFKALKRRVLPNTGEYDEWSVRLSPSGKTLLVDHYRPFRSQHFVMGTSSFAPLVPSAEGTLFPLFAISDNAITKPDAGQRSISIGDFRGGWRKLATALHCVSNPVFLKDDKILNACEHEVVVLATNGDELMRDHLNNNEHLEELVSVTPDGAFFAVSAAKSKGGFMDLSSVKRSDTTILVYNVGSHKRIFRIRVDPVPHADYDFALAPDGSKLAIMIDGSVKVYMLNPKATAK